MANYTGTSPDHINGAIPDRFFYGLRRTDNGELFVGKMDQMSTTDAIMINNPGDPAQNYPSFEEVLQLMAKVTLQKITKISNKVKTFLKVEM